MALPQQPKKKWVFTELVKNPNNIEQLVSYAIYKGFKDEKARTLRSEGKNDAEIDAELEKYHDHCLSSKKQLNVFRDTAKATLDGYVAATNTDLQVWAEQQIAKFEADKKKEIEGLQKKLDAAEKAALKKLMAGAEQYGKQIKKPEGILEHIMVWGKSILKFLFSGVPKLFATAFSIGLLFTIWGFFNGDAITGLRNGLYKMVDITVPGKKVDNGENGVDSISPNQHDEKTNEKPRNSGA